MKKKIIFKQIKNCCEYQASLKIIDSGAISLKEKYGMYVKPIRAVQFS